MNRLNFNLIYDTELTPKQKKVLPLFLEGKSDDEIIKELGASDRTVTTQHLKNICRKFSIEGKDYRNSLIKLFQKYKPEIISPKVLKKYGFITEKPPHFPDIPEPLDSPFYIERPPLESTCYSLLTQPGNLIHIKAPRKMGKTSLCKRIIAEAKKKKYHTFYLNLSLIDASIFASIDKFLLSFYNYIIQELPSVPPLKKWDADTPVMISCTRHFQNLLKNLNQVLVLVLDEVDEVFEYPGIYQDFFPMLRHWYQQTNESETWKKLRIIVSHCTDDYGRLDINQSPFNVGYPIKLEEFNQEQVQKLAFRHGLGREIFLPLMDLVQGHPYLIRLALYYLCYEQKTFKKLLQNATSDTGIYKNHLLYLLNILQHNQDLKAVFKQILSQKKPVEFKEKTIQIHQLESMGLIKFLGDFIQVRCKLYQQYFGERL